MIERLNDFQALINGWKQRAFPEEWCTPEAEAVKVTEEMHELEEALKTENPQLIVEEAADVIIASLLLIGSLGYDTDNLILKKLDSMYRKYNPILMDELWNGKMTFEEAIAEAKQRWNNR